eukprot:12610465-Prorocentrum_lima.AAC.1
MVDEGMVLSLAMMRDAGEENLERVRGRRGRGAAHSSGRPLVWCCGMSGRRTTSLLYSGAVPHA